MSRALVSAHMVSVKILNINRRYTTDINVALPFETDAQVLAAWDYIMANGRADSFRYDPEVEGEDPDRAWMDQYMDSYRANPTLRTLDANQVRRAIRKIWGAEMNYDIRELLSPGDGR